MVNQLVAVAAVFGVAAGGWGFWLEARDHFDTVKSRERITSACAGLVTPDQVLGLQGGTTQVETGDDTIPEGMATGQCAVYSSAGGFTLTVYPNPSDEHGHQIGDLYLRPFYDQVHGHTQDLTRVADHSLDQPLGTKGRDDGHLGSYDYGAVTVKIACRLGGQNKFTSVNARAAVLGGRVSDRDRLTLAHLAVGAAYKAAPRLGCPPLTPAPTSLAPLHTPDTHLVPATSVNGSCAWYRAYLDGAGPDRLPDRALAAPVGAHSHTESCLLAASRAQVERTWPQLNKDEQEHAAPRTLGPWWLETESFFGDEAREVSALSYDTAPPGPGTAGSDPGQNVWWASSTCDGQPAVHTLTVSLSYDDVVVKRLRTLFRAYVSDVAARRHCTHVKFPAASAFSDA